MDGFILRRRLMGSWRLACPNAEGWARRPETQRTGDASVRARGPPDTPMPPRAASSTVSAVQSFTGRLRPSRFTQSANLNVPHTPKRLPGNTQKNVSPNTWAP